MEWIIGSQRISDHNFAMEMGNGRSGDRVSTKNSCKFLALATITFSLRSPCSLRSAPSDEMTTTTRHSGVDIGTHAMVTAPAGRASPQVGRRGRSRTGPRWGLFPLLRHMACPCSHKSLSSPCAICIYLAGHYARGAFTAKLEVSGDRVGKQKHRDRSSFLTQWVLNGGSFVPPTAAPPS